MYQVLLKDDYKYTPNQYSLFIEQCNALFNKDFLSMFKKQEYVSMYVYCNVENKIEIYFDFSNEEKRYMLESFLKTLFSVEEVFEIDKKFDMTVMSSISKYAYATRENYNIREFNQVNNRYILNSLVPNTGYRLNFYFKNDDSISVSLNVFASDLNKKKESANICSTIQQITSREFEGVNKKVKLHVKYDDSSKRFFDVTIDELLNFAFIPYEYDKVLTTSNFASYVEVDKMSSGVCVGKSLHPAQKDKYLHVPIDTIREHVFISGKTGAGKSSMFEMMMESILRNKLDIGITLFDPKANAALGVINIIEKLINDNVYTAEEIYSRVKVVDFANKNALFKINLLDKDMDATVLLNYFRDIFKSTGVRLEKIITNAVGILMCDTKEHFIGDVLKLLKDTKYRMELLERVKNNHEARIYYEYFISKSEFTEEEISPIENRISPFQKNNHSYEMFNSGDDLEVRKWMDEGYIVLFDMSSFSPIENEIVTGYIELKFYITCKKRENNAKSHILAIDECHQVQNDVHGKIHAEGRSQGLHLLLMTQFLKQMKPSIVESILEASATKIVLKQGGAGKELAKNFGAKEEELQSLDVMTSIVKTIVDRKDVYVKTEIDPPFRYDYSGNTIEYKVTVNDEIVINPQIAVREKELKNKMSEIMISQYPIQNIVKKNLEISKNKFTLNKDVFV